MYSIDDIKRITGLTDQKDIAKRFGVKPQAVTNWVTLGVPKKVALLLQELEKTNKVQEPELVSVPVYDVQASAGPGAINHHEDIAEWISFSPEFAVTHFGTRSGLVCMKTTGNSMEPTMKAGELIVINTQECGRIARDGAMYLLRMGDTLSVKRVTRSIGGMLDVTSDNPSGPRYQINLSNLAENDMEIVGRIVFHGVMG